MYGPDMILLVSVSELIFRIHATKTSASMLKVSACTRMP